jgi:hypothetical protein
MVRGWNPGRDMGIFSSVKRPDPIRFTSNLLFYGCRQPLAGVKMPGREVNNPHPSNTEIMNAWNYTCAPHIFLHGGEMQNFTVIQVPVYLRAVLILRSVSNRSSASYLYYELHYK